MRTGTARPRHRWPLAGCALAAAAALAGCSKEELVVVHVTVPSDVSSDCVVLEMTAEGHPSREEVVARASGQDEVRVAIYRGTWPPGVSLEAYIPVEPCGAPAFSRLARSPVLPATFGPASAPPVVLEVGRPAPTALVFSGTLGQQPAGTCSPPVQLQLRDARNQVAPSSSPVIAAFSSAPDINLEVFTDGACLTAVTTAEFPAAGTSIPVSVRGEPGSTTLTASATGLASGQLSVDLALGLPARLAVMSPPQTVLVGDCSEEVTLELQDAAGNAVAAPGNLPLDLQLSGSGNSFFFSDGQCNVPLGASPVISQGSTGRRVYFRPYTPGPARLTAGSGSLVSASQDETIAPLVRHGNCTLPDGFTNIDCPVVPAPISRNRAFVFFQAAQADGDPEDAMVRCLLASPPDRLICARTQTDGSVIIRWSVVELSYARVQHLGLDCGATGPFSPSVITLPQPAAVGRSFLLHSVSTVGNGYGDDFRSARFVDAGSAVEFVGWPPTCVANWSYALQVVELVGATVTRGTTLSDAGVINVTGLSTIDRGRSFLLYSWGNSATTGPICDRMYMGEMDSDTSVRFSLGGGPLPTCAPKVTALSWERVQLPSGSLVQSPTVTMAPGVYSTTTTLNPAVNLSRTTVFAGGQAVGGQGDGRTSYFADDLAAEAIARHSLADQSTLQLSRDSSDAGASWRSYVVEFQP